MPTPIGFCPGPVSRRTFFQAGIGGVVGLGLPTFLQSQAHAAPAVSSKEDPAVIFIWLPGGPPHLEMYDMKPQAPAEFRGAFHPIPTKIPGIEVCEHLPLHAQIADKFTLIRSFSHNFSDHGGGHKRFMTGRDPLLPVGFVNDYPAVPSMVSKVVEGKNPDIPCYVNGTDGGRDGIDVFSFGSAYLGPSTHPFTVVGNPAAADFQLRNLELQQAMQGRLDDRKKLLTCLDNLSHSVDRFGTMDAMDSFNQRAINLLTSDKAKKAFDLTLEPEAVRNKYGMHQYGQRALMARRLVEAGVTWVTMVWENPIPPGKDYPPGVIYNWDSHAVNGHIFDDALYRFPHYDRAVHALIEDLYERGLDKRVLLIVTGEFGRTPRLSYFNGQPGRDHWPQAMSLLVSGGGMKMGQVIGSTNSRGEVPKDRPMSPNNLWATVLKHLGIDQHRAFPDHRGRPMPILPHGEPIPELLGV